MDLGRVLKSISSTIFIIGSLRVIGVYVIYCSHIGSVTLLKLCLLLTEIVATMWILVVQLVDMLIMRIWSDLEVSSMVSWGL